MSLDDRNTRVLHRAFGNVKAFHQKAETVLDNPVCDGCLLVLFALNALIVGCLIWGPL